VARVPWPEVENRLRGGALAILPIGAAAKEHGYHLPMDTDFVQAEWLVGELVARGDVVVWPTLGYGYYPAFVDYPGSISLTRETFTAVIVEIVRGMVAAGARRSVILNTGISTIPPLEAATAALSAETKVDLVNVYSGPSFTAAVDAVQAQSFGGHADEIETSLMLAIAQGRVDMSRARPSPGEIRRGLFNRRNPEAPNYSPNGVNGDPTLATRTKGERLAAALLRDVMARLGWPT